MSPPGAPWMRQRILVDPFWVSHSEMLDMTDREMWEDYIYPELQRQEQSEGKRLVTENDPPGTVRDGSGKKIDPEVALALLTGVGFADKDSAAAAMKKRQESEHDRSRREPAD